MNHFNLRQQYQNEEGLTLIEVLGAMMVLSILVLSFVALSQYTGQSSMKSDRESQALLIAQQKLNEMRTLIVANETMPSASDPSILSGQLSSPDPDYVVSYTTTPVGVTPSLPAAWADMNTVSIQAMVILQGTGDTKVSRVLTVSVAWEGI